MSKERLEEIKKELELDWSDISYVVNQDDVKWLINLVEKLEQQNKRYREALEFYADENNYREQELKGIVPPRPITFKPILHDYGSIARQALEGKSDA